MQRWDVELDDGNIYTVEASTPQEAEQIALGYDPVAAAKQKASSEADMAMEGMSWGDKALATVGGGAKQALAGIGQLIMPDSAQKALGIDDETLAMEQIHREQLIDKTPGGMALDIAGQMAPTLFPAAKALQVGGKLSALPAAARAAGVGAAEAAATTPGDRGTAAMFGAAGGAGGEMIGRALPGAMRKFTKADPEAEALMRAGIDVPSWKQGGAGRHAASRWRALPFVGQYMDKTERKAFEQMNRKLVAGATPPGGRVPKAIGRESLKDLRAQWDDLFERTYRGREFFADEKVFGEFRDILASLQHKHSTLSGGLTPRGDEIGGTINRVARDLASRKKLNYGELKALRRELDNMVSNLYKGGDARGVDELQQAISALDDLATRALPPQQAALIKSIGQPYGNFKRLQRGMGYKGAQAEDLVSPDQMLGATKALDRSPGKVRWSEGVASPQQGGLQTMANVMGGDIPKVGPGTAEKLSALGTTMMALKHPVATTAALTAFPMYEMAHKVARKYGIPIAEAMELLQRQGYAGAAGAGIASNTGEQ